MFAVYHDQGLKPVSHQPCESRAPICDNKFLGFARQPHGVVNNTARLPYEKKMSQGLPQQIFDVDFLCDLFVFSERRTTDARHTRLLQDTQGVRTTDIIVRQPRICLTTSPSLCCM